MSHSHRCPHRVYSWLLVVVTLLVAASGSTASATGRVPTDPPLSGAHVYQAVWRSVLCVGASGDCTGTAWVIEPGLAVTAAHVVKTKRNVDLYSAFAGPVAAAVVGADAQRDIAFLTFDSSLMKAPPVRMRSLDMLSEMGETLYALGYGGSEVKSAGGVGAASVRNGLFSQMPNLGPRLGPNIKTIVPAVPGDSGGPLVDSWGNVVGMVRAKDTDGVYSYAVPVDKVQDAMQRLKDAPRPGA